MNFTKISNAVRNYSSIKRPSWVKFAAAKHGEFTQRKPVLGNQYLEDQPLMAGLRRNLPAEVLEDIQEDLTALGMRTAVEIDDIGRDCERFPPKFNPQDAWGERIQDLWTCEAWRTQKKISAEEGIVATAYERKHKEWSRLHQLVKLYLYAPSAGLYTCPLAMTDGAAQTIEALNLADKHPEIKEAYRRLTTRNPDEFWTSGQWMTERKGGSDVASGTETTAIRDEKLPEKYHRLYGYKWFSSATDADMTLTLARIADGEGNVVAGNKGISLFYLKLRDDKGKLDNIHIVRLKDKLGTRQLPTAELLLDGTKALQISDQGRGIAGISNMLTITRIYNSTCSISPMRRFLNLARDYAENRDCFGSRIMDHPLHVNTLAEMEVEHRGALLLLIKTGIWLGRTECKVATDQDRLLLRLLTPVMKLYTGKQGVAVASEGLEAFGGQGYMEDTGLPTMFRDSQVLPIWEGTTNILSLDVLRAILKTNGEVLKAFAMSVNELIKDGELHNTAQIRDSANRVKVAAAGIIDFAQNNQDIIQVAARDFAYSLARTYIGALLVNQACERDAIDIETWTAAKWCLGKDLCPVQTNLKNHFYSMECLNANRMMLKPVLN